VAPHGVNYIALLSNAVCAMHNWSDAVHIGKRVFSLVGDGVLATRCFATQRDALCWLTSPVNREAVAGATAIPDEAHLVLGDDDGCLAVRTHSSASCFGLDARGCASALAMVRDAMVGTCIIRRFGSSSVAWRWLVADVGKALLDVVHFSPAPAVRGASCSTPLLLASRASAAAPAMSGSRASVSRAPGARVARERLVLPGKRSASASLSSDDSSCLSDEDVVELDCSDATPFRRARPLANAVPAVSSDRGRKRFKRPPVSTVQPLELRTLPPRDARAYPSDPSAASTAVESPSSGLSRRPAPVEVLAAVPGAAASLRSNGEVVARSGGRAGGTAGRPSGRTGRDSFRTAGPADSPSAAAPIGRLAASGRWGDVCEQLFARINSAFVSGGPGAGKSTLLRKLRSFLVERYAADGEVVVVAPTGTSAKTAEGMTYHSFFGFGRDYVPLRQDPKEEAERLLATDRYGPIKVRLRRVRALLVDEISLVSAANFGVMVELLSIVKSDTRPCLWFAFGDFLQLGPVKGHMAYTAPCWSTLFGNAFLELTGTFRQRDPAFVRAVRDARVGDCSAAVEELVKECWIQGNEYDQVKRNILHLVPRHKLVVEHNWACLSQLSPGVAPKVFRAVDTVQLDPDRDMSLRRPNLERVNSKTRTAALADCVATPALAHCLHARVMVITNRKKDLGVCHGSIGYIVDYDKTDGSPIVRLENHVLPAGIERGNWGLRDMGDTWIEVACPPVDFTARVLAAPGVLAVRTQVPLVLGWASTIHMSQSLSISEAVLDLSECFEAGMVHTALSRVPDKARLHIKSFASGRLFADQGALKLYHEWRRL